MAQEMTTIKVNRKVALGLKHIAAYSPKGKTLGDVVEGLLRFSVNALELPAFEELFIEAMNSDPGDLNPDLVLFLARMLDQEAGELVPPGTDIKEYLAGLAKDHSDKE